VFVEVDLVGVVVCEEEQEKQRRRNCPSFVEEQRKEEKKKRRKEQTSVVAVWWGSEEEGFVRTFVEVKSRFATVLRLQLRHHIPPKLIDVRTSLSY
jgi:hypothetical protein